MAGDNGWGDSGGSGWGGGGDTAASSGFGGGGGDRPKGCFKCGEEGHMSRECPKPDICKKCKEEGHMARDCTKPDVCRKCNEEGHMSRECPQGGGDSNCRNCGEEGHMARDCEQPERCRICKQEGHISTDCPDKKEDDGKCFKCKGDHMARDCDQPDVCRKCGEEGHMSRDCANDFRTRTIKNDDGTEREIYVPKEKSDDALFESSISSGINFDKFDKIPVRCTGENVPKPIGQFQDAELRSILLDNVKKSGYAKPTPIQKHAIPCILAKRDLMGCAQTGSGKTAAFLLPILHQLLAQGVDPNSHASPQSPQAVVVAPTRELAIQIKDEARKFAQGSMLKAVVAYGGTSVGSQLSILERGCNVLIATPGRLMDFVDKGKVCFDKVQFLVLDEADRMLDMGFKPDIERIVGAAGMPGVGERQTLMFSATFSEEVQGMSKDFMRDYIFLTIGVVGGASSDVEQIFYEVEKFAKRDKLKDILKGRGDDEKVLVFVETKRNADFIATFLSSEGLPTTSIHGDRLQREREEALNDFKQGRRPILVATAVAARGLDIKGVAHVINFDLPKEVDEYVHRIGRTGRVGNTGKASSFFDRDNNGDLAAALVKILSDSQQTVPDFLAEFAASGGGGSYSGGGTFGGKDIRADTNNNDDDWE